MKILSSLLVLAAGLLLAPGAQAAPPQGVSAQQALDVAKDGVDPSLRSRIVSVYGTGTPAGISTWWVIFYDPGVDSHGRAVRVENGQIVRTYEAKGGVVYGDTLTLAPGDVHGVNRALAAAQDYAGQHALAYDRVRALLRQSADGGALRWRIQLLDGAVSRGFVFVDASRGSSPCTRRPARIMPRAAAIRWRPAPTRRGTTSRIRSSASAATCSSSSPVSGRWTSRIEGSPPSARWRVGGRWHAREFGAEGMPPFDVSKAQGDRRKARPTVARDSTRTRCCDAARRRT